jgi:hypothetical protein
MKILLYDPPLAAPGGFFSFVYQALQKVKGAELTSRSRPLPQMTEPREHLSAWMEVDGRLVFLDMSDHVFLLDREALRRCDVYFKTNLHRKTLLALLAETDESVLAEKVYPFFSFAGYLSTYLDFSPGRRLYDLMRGRREDVCDVVGVYDHLRRDGETSVYDAGGPELTPSRVHYWARVHTLEALRGAGLSGTLRLTSRYQKTLEDGALIFSNLSQPAYRRAIIRSRMLVINTLPHALFPWKASEALALGRPFIVDVPPLTEFPEPFRLQEGAHFLSLLPPADFSDSLSGRVLHKYSLADFREGAQRVTDVLRDPERMRHMQDAVESFRRRALCPQTVANYITETVEARV